MWASRYFALRLCRSEHVRVSTVGTYREGPPPGVPFAASDVPIEKGRPSEGPWSPRAAILRSRRPGSRSLARSLRVFAFLDGLSGSSQNVPGFVLPSDRGIPLYEINKCLELVMRHLGLPGAVDQNFRADMTRLQ